MRHLERTTTRTHAPRTISRDLADRLPSVSIHAMLEGLARAHALVLAIDESRQIVWLSDGLGLVSGGTSRLIGRSVEVLLDEVEAIDNELFRARTRGFAEELRDKGRVTAARFDLAQPPASFPIEASAFPIETEAQHTLLIALVDRLERHEEPDVFESAHQTRPRLDFILDSTPDGVITVDRFGVVQSANAAAGRLLGHDPDALVHRPFSHFVAESGRARGMDRRFAAMTAIESEELEIRRADGSRAWLSISARTGPVRRGHSVERTETIVFIRDVTERHEAREALELKNEELEHYVRSVSHDLRSPLTSLLGFTRLLESDYRDVLHGQGLYFLERIEESGRNMERLLNDLLSLSRISAAPECRIAVDPRPVLQQLATEFKLRLDEKGIALSIPASPDTILCDRTRLYQLFSNLIGNAVAQFEPDTGGRIDVGIESVDGGWSLSVTDNGPGIARADQKRIFGLFETIEVASRAEKGSGLGLAIVQKIAAQHSGRAWVESEPGQGARFVVFLPEA